MSTKDIDFSKVALPEDEFDAMMRRALGAPPPSEEASTANAPDGKAEMIKAKRAKDKKSH